MAGAFEEVPDVAVGTRTPTKTVKAKARAVPKEAKEAKGVPDEVPGMLMGPQIQPAPSIIAGVDLRTFVLSPSPVHGRISSHQDHRIIKTNEVSTSSTRKLMIVL